jgi:hypothetical protein
VDTKHGHEHEAPAGIHHEISDVHVRPLAWLGVGLALLVVISIVAMKGVFTLLDRQQAQRDVAPPPMMTQRPQQPPEPRLQTTPVPNRKLILEQENRQLTTYSWVDSKSGVVRIPVDQAMKLLAERGLPVRDGSIQPSAASGQRTGTGTSAGSETKPSNKETERR